MALQTSIISVTVGYWYSLVIDYCAHLENTAKQSVNILRTFDYIKW